MTETKQDIPTDPVDQYVGGDTKILSDDVDEPDGTAKDLTNATVRFALADYPGADPLVSKNSDESSDVRIVDATGGILEVEVGGDDTKGLGDENGEDYHYEIEVVDSNGSISTVTTGTWTIHANTI